MRLAKIHTEAVVLQPTTSAAAGPNALFRSTADGSLNDVSEGGTSSPVGGGADTSLFRRQMQCAAPIAAGAPVSKMGNGRIIPADSDEAEGQRPIGFALQQFASVGDLGEVFLVGPALTNIISGLGFTPGDTIWLDETTGGLTNDAAHLQPGNDSYIRLGIADCAPGAATTAAVDLILTFQVVARP